MPPTQLAYPSPKRKRDEPPPTPLLNTALALRPVSTPQRSRARPSAGDSPRNAVADQMRSMSLDMTAAIPMSPLTPTHDVAHKKPKLDALPTRTVAPLDTDFASADLKVRKSVSMADAALDSTAAMMPRLDALTEIPETPQTPQPRLSPDIASFAQPITAFVSSCDYPSPLQHFAANHALGLDNCPFQPGPRTMSPAPSLTWQVSEITGHLNGPSTDPDDDGTGLNGIGFKPTPAIAYARSQKRRQQLSDWKAREAREARARRSERRRRGVGGKASRESIVERELPVPEVDFSPRTVKFAV